MCSERGEGTLRQQIGLKQRPPMFEAPTVYPCRARLADSRQVGRQLLAAGGVGAAQTCKTFSSSWMFRKVSDPSGIPSNRASCSPSTSRLRAFGSSSSCGNASGTI
jgi:hypothetical protein